MELIPAENVTLAAPTAASTSSSLASVGAPAAARLAAPNANAAIASSDGLTRRRVPIASAPPTAPIAIAVVSAAYVVALPWNVNLASSGRITWKLNESVPTIAITPSGTLSSGVARTYRTASRSWPRSRGLGTVGCSSRGSISHSASSIAPNDIELIKKQGAIPTDAITMPASAGPMIRDDWTIRLLRLTALTTRSRPTSSITKLWRAGLSTALTEPRTNTSASTTSSETWPVAVSSHSVSAGAPSATASTRAGAAWRRGRRARRRRRRRTASARTEARSSHRPPWRCR